MGDDNYLSCLDMFNLKSVVYLANPHSRARRISSKSDLDENDASTCELANKCILISVSLYHFLFHGWDVFKRPHLATPAGYESIP